MNSIRELIKDIQKRPKEGIILRYADNEGIHCITNETFLHDVKRSAVVLYDHFAGDVAGKHIAIVAPASYVGVVTIIAGELLGMVVILLNPIEEKKVLEKMIKSADTDLVINTPREFMDSHDLVDDRVSGIDKFFLDRPYDFSFLIFTSGTQGNMKGVMLSQSNLLASAGDVTGVFGGIAAIRSDIVFNSCYVMLPLYHVFGLSIVLTAIVGGVILDLCVDFRQFYRDLQLLNSEIIACPPMAIKMFVSDLSRGNESKWGNGLKFIFSGAAGLPIEEQKRITEHGYFIAFGYGMTETAGPATVNYYPDKYSSVGKPALRTVIEIRANEIFIKNDSVMLGYYKNPEDTADVLKDGWIATGDLGYIDEEGFLYLTGRKKNLIILSSGENVSPEELEAKLYGNQSVKECKVYEKDGRIVADVYAPGTTEEEIKALVSDLNSKVPMYKRIQHVEIRDRELEKTASGKIKR